MQLMFPFQKGIQINFKVKKEKKEKICSLKWPKKLTAIKTISNVGLIMKRKLKNMEELNKLSKILNLNKFNKNLQILFKKKNFQL